MQLWRDERATEISTIRTEHSLANRIAKWAGLDVLPLGLTLLTVQSGLFVVKMEFLLGNPYSTPVGQCVGT